MSTREIATDVEIQKGMRVLFVTQIFSTLSYAILYSTLTLFGTEVLKLPTSTVLALTGSFLAFNFGLHFLGGYMGGRFISNRLLFSISMGIQVISAIFLVSTVAAPPHLRVTFLMFGLAVFLTGSGINVTCMNSMVTQLFDDPEDMRREKAFLWNYSGMNIGFFVGFGLAGYFQNTQNFGMLFALGGLANLLAIILIVLNWKTVRDRETILTDLVKKQHVSPKKQFAKGILTIVITLLIMIVLIRHASLSNAVITLIFLVTVAIVVVLAIGRKKRFERNRMIAYVFLLIAAFVFWVLYQLAPMALVLFTNNNVHLAIGHFKIAPQWVQNINTVVIVIGGPVMAIVLDKIRKSGRKVSLPLLFGISLVLIGVGFVILPVGIHFATAAGIVGFSWVFWSYFLQSIAELCISPIGYAAIGRLAPRKLQNLLMGLWCMMTGVAAIGADYISQSAVGNFNAKELANPHLTNPHYAFTFAWIGIVSMIIGGIMFIFIPKLNKLINKEDTPGHLAEAQILFHD